ncbi:MAG TPA: oligosaccharide flippase family protein, partial [Bacteroidales bacterium]
GVDRQVYNIVGTESYGFYFAVLNFSVLFYIILDLGITNFNNRNIAQYNHLLNKHLAGIGMLKMLLGLVYGVSIILVGWLWGYDKHQMYLLAWVGFNQFLLSFILYLRSNISGLLLFKTESYLSVLDRLLMILICGIFIWTPLTGGKITIEWFVYSQTAAYLITFCIALFILLKKSGRLKFSWNFPFYLMILKRSYPFALLALLMSFYNRIDPVLLEKILPGSMGGYQSGIYSASFRLLDAGQNFALLFAVLLLPLFSKMIKDKTAVEHLLKLSFSLIITGSLIIAITSSFYGKEIMQLMYTPFQGESELTYLARMADSTEIFKLLMFSLVAISATYIFGTLLTANNSLKYLNLIALAGLIINLAMNLVLIPRFLALGSAYASITSQGFTALLQIGLAYKLFRFRINYRLIANILITILLLVLIGFILQFVHFNNWIFSMLLMLLAGIGISVLLKLINIPEFLSILKSE